MKTKLFALLAFICIGVTSCYDDSALLGQLADHEQRISTLETLCKQMNTNISSLQTIVEAMQENDYITSVAPITESGAEVGYTITFTSGKTITIYHGKDGADGKDGLNGTDGKDGVDGTDGKDGHTPVIGVKQDTDGIYYWTLDGEWLLDNAGNKIKAEGTDGKDGANGEDGTDGITPQLKIEEGFWYVSYDNGATWQHLYKAVGEDGKDGVDGANGDSFFKSVEHNDKEVIFELANGTIISIPFETAFQLILDKSSIVVEAQNSYSIPYRVEGAKGRTLILVEGDDFNVELESLSDTTGVINIKSWRSSHGDEFSGEVYIWALNDAGVSSQMIEIIAGVFYSSTNTRENKFILSTTGGNIQILVSSNIDYNVETTAEWIQYVETKAVNNDILIFSILENLGDKYRNGKVVISTSHASIEFECMQLSQFDGFIIKCTAAENESYGFETVMLDTLVNKSGLHIHEVLGYSSWEDLSLSFCNYYEQDQWETVFYGYDINTGELFSETYNVNGFGYWTDGNGSVTDWGESARCCTENHHYLDYDPWEGFDPEMSIMIMPGNITAGDEYRMDYLFIRKKDGESYIAPVTILINVGPYQDPEAGLYPEEATPGTH